MLAIPLILLYAFSIGIAYVFARRRQAPPTESA
jgi:Sec-independent protein secretion pathway component TatC